MIATDYASLLELAWAAPLAAFIVVFAWGLVVYGVATAGEARRDGRTAVVVVHVAIAGFGAAVFVAAIVVGLLVMSAKG